MRDFKAKEFPQYYQVNWESAHYGTAIFLGSNVFMNPDGEMMDKEIDEFKEMARHHGVLLTMRREYKKTIQDKSSELLGFTFYCIGTTPANSRKQTDYDPDCMNDIVRIFKDDDGFIKLQSVMKDYSLPHSEPKIRNALNHLCAIGYIESEPLNRSDGHIGRPTTKYRRKETLMEYVIPARFG